MTVLSGVGIIGLVVVDVFVADILHLLDCIFHRFVRFEFFHSFRFLLQVSSPNSLGAKLQSLILYCWDLLQSLPDVASHKFAKLCFSDAFIAKYI